jgi:hypothetical protein
MPLMIISHKHRFIFLKTMKTASSSIEIALSTQCGPEDIITPTRGDLGEQRTIPEQNYRINHPLVPKRPLWRRVLRRPERHYHPTVGYYEHMPAWRIKAYVGDDIWRRYYKFAFVRNPWDRQLSFYFYKTRNEKPRRSFDAFMRSKRRAIVESREIYTVDDAIAVDFLGRYENLEAHFKQALIDIGLDPTIALPEANVSNKPKHRSYRDSYNERTRVLVADWYAQEIAEQGYEF